MSLNFNSERSLKTDSSIQSRRIVKTKQRASVRRKTEFKMKFVINSVTKCSGRLGKITLERLPDLELKTPLLILNTKVRNNGKINFHFF